MSEDIVPANADLRDMPWMPLDIARLKRSKAWLACKKAPELAFYMINLWTASWHELPPASMEDDDAVLADAAMCDEKRWLKVKEKVLRGWIKVDGRLFHPVVAEKARETWQKKDDYRQRLAEARAAKQAKRSAAAVSISEPASTSIAVPVIASITEPIIAPATGHKGEGEREGQGEGQGQLRKKDSEPNGSDGIPSLEAEVYRQGKRILGKNAGGQITLLRKVAGSDVQALALLEEAERKENRAEWVAGVIRNRGDTRETDELGLPKTAIGDLGKSTDELYGRLGIV